MVVSFFFQWRPYRSHTSLTYPHLAPRPRVPLSPNYIAQLARLLMAALAAFAPLPSDFSYPSRSSVRNNKCVDLIP